METKVDVLIVGSGPSGSSTALHLAQYSPSLAHRTVVLEKTSHPRHKLCGGGLVSDVDVILNNLGLNISDVPYVNANWTYLNFHNRGLRMKLKDIAFHVVRRREFDAWLANRVRDCGVTLKEETTVLKITPTDDGVVVETSRGTFRAQTVVGADGSMGVVRKAIPGNHGRVARLVEVILPPPTGTATDLQPASDEAVFEFRHIAAGVQGYFWNFPTKIDGKHMRNLGIFDSRVLDTPSPGSLKTFLEQDFIHQGANLSEHKLEGHPIHLFSPRSLLSAPHVLLVGDAAGADPLLGEGISLALGYGKLAAHAIHTAFEQNDFHFNTYTNDVSKSSMGRMLNFRYQAARWIYHFRQPALQRLLWWHLQPITRYVIQNHVFGWAS